MGSKYKVGIPKAENCYFLDYAISFAPSQSDRIRWLNFCEVGNIHQQNDLKLFYIFEGPAKLPLVGSLHYFYGKPRSLNRNIKDLISKFGRIAGIFIGSQKVVVIADLNLLKGEAGFNFTFTLNNYLQSNIENS